MVFTCSKLTTETLEQGVNLEHISYLVLVFILLNLNLNLNFICMMENVFFHNEINRCSLGSCNAHYSRYPSTGKYDTEIVPYIAAEIWSIDLEPLTNIGYYQFKANRGKPYFPFPWNKCHLNHATFYIIFILSFNVSCQSYILNFWIYGRLLQVYISY